MSNAKAQEPLKINITIPRMGLGTIMRPRAAVWNSTSLKGPRAPHDHESLPPLPFCQKGTFLETHFLF